VKTNVVGSQGTNSIADAEGRMRLLSLICVALAELLSIILGKRSHSYGTILL